MPNHTLLRTFALCCGVVVCLIPFTGEAQSFSEFRRKYLEAESFKDTGIHGIEPSNIKSVFYQILKDVITEEPEIADDLVIQTHRLTLQNMAEKGAFKPIKNGGTYISGYLAYYEDVVESLDCIGLMVRTYRNDQKGEIPFTGIGNNAQQFALFSHFLSHGGNYDCTSAMDKMLVELRTVCGDGESVFLAPYFFDFAYHLRPGQRNQLAIWASEKSRDTDLTTSGIGDAIQLGLAMFQRAEHVKIDSRELLRGNQLDLRLIEILQNSNLSPAWRFGLTTLMGRNFREELSPILRLEIGRVMTLALREMSSISATSFKFSIAAFLRGSDEDPAWKNQGKELVEAWEKRSSKSLQPMHRRLDPSGEWVVPMMELTCRVGTKSQISQHFQRYCFDDLVYPGIWISLIKSGEHHFANQARLKQANVTEYSPDYYDADIGFNEQLAKTLPAYLNTVRDENDRLLAELLLSAAPNPENQLQTKTDSTIQTRIDNFLEKHDQLPDWTGNQQVRAFEILSLSHRNEKAKAWLSANQIGLEARIEQDEPRIRPFWAARIEMHAAAEELENGLSFPIELWWGRSVKDDNQTIARRRGDLCRAILMMMDERMIAACRDNDIERLNHFLDISRNILETIPEYVYRVYVRQFGFRALTAHALCGKIDQWDDWWLSLDPVRKRHLVSILKYSSELVPAAEKLLNPHDLDPEQAFVSTEKRRQIIADILGVEWISESYTGYSNLANAVSGRLLTERDLHDVAEKIARKAPRGGSSWREFLGILADHDQIEEALRVVEEEISDADPTLPLITALKIEKLQILRALDRRSDAENYLSEFEATSFDLPREYQATVRNLEKR